jgi:hypothetical protein
LRSTGKTICGNWLPIWREERQAGGSGIVVCEFSMRERPRGAGTHRCFGGGRDLLNEIESSTSRISDLVRAIKEYTYMDQSPVQNVDIVKSLETRSPS